MEIYTTRLGFKYISTTEPNYWYFNTVELIRYHRYTFRKDVLVKKGYDISKTEKQIMSELGYLRIYDVGQLKYELTFDY